VGMNTATAKEPEMQPTTETAAQAYARNLRAARELADRIADELARLELGNDQPVRIEWGDAGEMAEMVKRLRTASHLMFGEGDDAPEAE